MSSYKTYVVRGKRGTVRELATYFGVPPAIAHKRIAQHGWEVERAVTEAPRPRACK